MPISGNNEKMSLSAIAETEGTDKTNAKQVTQIDIH